MSKEEQFDGVLLSLAQQLEGGVPELMDVLFSFLRRKTDFFMAPDKAKDMVLGAFSKNANRVKDDEQKKKKAEEERKKRQKQEEEAEAKKPQVMEIDDEEEKRILAEQEAARKKSKEEVSDAPAAAAPLAPRKFGVVSDDPEDLGKLLPNTGGGSETEKYTWTQSLQELTAQIYLPQGTRARDLNVTVKPTHVTIGLKGQTPIIDDDLEKPVKTSDLFWNVEDNKLLVLTLTKVNQMEWWGRFVKSEEEISTRRVQPETSRVDELDDETQAVVRKMRFDQDQKEKGLPSSDDLQKHGMLKQFMEKHPEMDFSKAKFS